MEAKSVVRQFDVVDAWEVDGRVRGEPAVVIRYWEQQRGQRREGHVAFD